jgi:predicted transport protein
MKFSALRKYVMALPEVTEEPHHHFGSFRVRGKLFVTVPPEQEHIHIFVSEQQREQALALYPEFAEKLLWGGKVVGVRVTLAPASLAAVRLLVRQAWESKARRRLCSNPKVKYSSRTHL